MAIQFMKAGSDNFRSRSIKGIMKWIKTKDLDVIVHEPMLNESTFYRSLAINNLINFNQQAEAFVANRINVF
jgi:UDPglucose 6-dehydrogenase